MHRKSIVTVGSQSFLMKDAHDAAAFVSLIDEVVTSSGYGKEETWKPDEQVDIRVQSVDARKVLSFDDEEGAAKLVDMAETAAAKSASEASEARVALSREKKFWEVRSKAHALHISDEKLREKLKTWHSWTEFKLEKEDA